MGARYAPPLTSSTDPGSDTVALPKRKLLVLLWAFRTLIWSIFTPPHLTFSARILLFQPLWAIRIYLGDTTWVVDLTLLLGLHSVYSFTTGGWRLIRPSDFWWLDFSNRVFLLYLEVFALLGICGFFAGGIVYRGHQLKAAAEREAAASILEETIDEQLLPPLLIASRTTHQRLIPKRHAFSYSYLLVGIPIGVRGRIGRALSVDDGGARGWFHVDPADYLARGSRRHGLAEKLKRYLDSKGVADRDYSFAYLVTAPRFLGYNFNPVSFWYLYDGNAKLKYMVLEVNNTFGERRMYLLQLEGTKREADPDASSSGASAGAYKTFVYVNNWSKDFHVSPFNDRQGSYSLQAVDPLAEYQDNGQIRIDNTIILRTPESQPKIVARICSDGETCEAMSISTPKLAQFVMAWWWVGFLTFPRIVWEARKLFFQKKIRVWYRPEVVDTSVARAYTEDEGVLESFFRSWLTHVVEHAPTPLRLIYEPAHHEDDEIVLNSSDRLVAQDTAEHTLIIQIITPAFYSRFVHYAHAAEAFDRECLATEPENRTLAIKNASLLPLLLEAIKADANARRSGFGKPASSRRWQLRWFLQQRLRSSPAPPSYPHPESSPETAYHTSDIRAFGPSELDLFVRTPSSSTPLSVPAAASTLVPPSSHSKLSFALQSPHNTTPSVPTDPGPTQGLYRRITTQLFFAQRFAFGIPELIHLADLSLRAILLVGAMIYCHRTDVGDIFRPRWLSAAETWKFAEALALGNAIHFWRLVKGVD